MKTKLQIEFCEIEPGNYHLFVKAKLEKTVLRLLLDTGASRTVFDKTFLERIGKSDGFNKSATEAVGLGSGGIETSVIVLNQVQLGSIKLGTLEVGVLDLSHVNTHYSLLGIEEIAGVLGSDLLHLYHAVINYHKATLTLLVT